MVGVNKPHPIIYNRILQELDIVGEECVFIDDSIERLKPAQELGMLTIHFTSARELDKRLIDLNIV